MSHDQATRQQFIDLRAQGLSYERIARQLGVARQTLINWSRELKADIDNLRALRLEALQEQYQVLQDQRIELLGRHRQQILEELETRDLGNVSTESLLSLLLRLTAALKKDETPIAFEPAEAPVPQTDPPPSPN